MADVILQTIVGAATSEEKLATDITLVVGGFLISGKIIDFKSYCDHHPLTGGIKNAIDSLKEDSFTNTDSQNLPNFIHLRDAKYYIPGTTPIPSNTGVFVRIPISSVSGFSFGRLIAEA